MPEISMGVINVARRTHTLSESAPESSPSDSILGQQVLQVPWYITVLSSNSSREKG